MRQNVDCASVWRSLRTGLINHAQGCKVEKPIALGSIRLARVTEPKSKPNPNPNLNPKPGTGKQEMVWSP